MPSAFAMPRQHIMARQSVLFGALLSVALLWPSVAHAHSFARSYNIPVPFWLYAWAGMAALLLSFLVLGWAMTSSAAAHQKSHLWRSNKPWFFRLLSWLALALLLLSIATGLWGNTDAYRNLNMTLFWIGIVLILPYATIFIGNVYAEINPWRSLVSQASQGRWRYPLSWGYWPALLAYMAFIWIELFAGFGPKQLSLAILIYSLFTLSGIWAFGLRDWLRYGDVFAVMLRLISQLAPIHYRAASTEFPNGAWQWRWPLSGIAEKPATHSSEVMFILFMLSSTAFDGLHATRWWSELYWIDGFALLSPWLGSNIVTAYPTLKAGLVVFETLALLLSPLLYFVLYVLCLWLAKRLLKSSVSLRELTYRFAYALIPIAVVYHASHYFTLVITQGSQLPRLASDPFGWGWNIFGTASANPWIILPEMNWVWHSQVVLILLGHIAGVYAAHQEALRCFATPRQAMLSQLPMLVFMMALTVFGLWILAQPLSPTA